MTLNCAWWCDSSSGAVGSIKYSFIGITCRVVVPIKDPVYGSDRSQFKKYWTVYKNKSDL